MNSHEIFLSPYLPAVASLQGVCIGWYRIELREKCTPPPPESIAWIICCELFYVVGASLRKAHAMTPKFDCPRMFVCNGHYTANQRPYKLNFLRRKGLHESYNCYAMNWSWIHQKCLYVCTICNEKIPKLIVPIFLKRCLTGCPRRGCNS